MKTILIILVVSIFIVFLTNYRADTPENIGTPLYNSYKQDLIDKATNEILHNFNELIEVSQSIYSSKSSYTNSYINKVNCYNIGIKKNFFETNRDRFKNIIILRGKSFQESTYQDILVEDIIICKDSTIQFILHEGKKNILGSTLRRYAVVYSNKVNKEVDDEYWKYVKLNKYYHYEITERPNY